MSEMSGEFPRSHCDVVISLHDDTTAQTIRQLTTPGLYLSLSAHTRHIVDSTPPYDVYDNSGLTGSWRPSGELSH